MLDFQNMDDTVLEHFCGGDGALVAKMFVDERNKILKGTLAPGSSIGVHCHETSSEMVFVLSGEGTMLYDGGEETLTFGTCHYCEKGHSHSLRNNGDEDLVFYAVVPQQ